jgi:hypothetical protein
MLRLMVSRVFPFAVRAEPLGIDCANGEQGTQRAAKSRTVDGRCALHVFIGEFLLQPYWDEPWLQRGDLFA